MSIPTVSPEEFNATFMEFIGASPTSFHAVMTAAELLDAAGFTRFDEREPWTQPAAKAYTIRDGGLIAWIMPKNPDSKAGLRIVGTHTDSPALKLKPKFAFEQLGYSQVDVEIYGGPSLMTWFDRELSVAGRVIDDQGQTYLVKTDPVARLSTLAPHLDRTIKSDVHLDMQNDIVPLFDVAPSEGLGDYLWKTIDVDPERVLGADLFLIPSQAPEVYGSNKQFLASYRLDNLASTYPALFALPHAEPTDDLQVLAAFDHEEIGSGTISGAHGTFLADVLARVGAQMGFDEDARLAWFRRGSAMSADVAHALNAPKAANYEPRTRAYLNQGPALKVSALGRYGTDAAGQALWQQACRAAGVEPQYFVNNNSIPGGSTIGPFIAYGLGIRTFDVGIVIHSMHSAREMCGANDPVAMSRVMAAYWAGA